MKKIKSIDIKNSSLYGDLRIDFSNELNCIMGGRGTGKTTLLYFIKSAIESGAENDEDTFKILKSNLGDGKITLEIESDDMATYHITKTIGEEPQPFKLPGQEYISIDKIFNEISCDIYEAGKIEQIGRSPKDRLTLLDKKVKIELIEFESQLNKIQIDCDSNAQDIKTSNRRLNKIDETLAQYNTVVEDFETHKKTQPEGIKEEEKNEFEQADIKEKIRKDEKRFFVKSLDSLREFSSDISFRKSELIETFLKEVKDKEKFGNKEIMNQGVEEANSVSKVIKETIEKLSTIIDSSVGKLELLLSNLNDKHEIQQAEFIQLKQKFEYNKEYINKYHSLSKKVDERRILLKDREELVHKQTRLKLLRKELVAKLNKTKQDIFNTRRNAVKELNASFDQDIVITLTPGGITEEFQEKLKNALRGSGMRYNELIPRITTHFSTDQFATIINGKDADTLKNIAGIDEARSKALFDVLFESDTIYEIESMYCLDLPEFHLKIADDSSNKEENYRKTDQLSMGQRCTTVLPIIFAVSNNPLIIDQPEDNLDNKYITKRIHEIIKAQKEKRQLIFITHNPNIPVLSDAERNFFLIYQDRKSSVDASGNITEVKDKIVNLLEGGEEAFKKRRDIYGF